MQLAVLGMLGINLIALFCSLKTLRFLEFPQNKIPYFNNEWKYAKCLQPSENLSNILDLSKYVLLLL
jgi:hypothetical protein